MHLYIIFEYSLYSVPTLHNLGILGTLFGHSLIIAQGSMYKKLFEKMMAVLKRPENAALDASKLHIQLRARPGGRALASGAGGARSREEDVRTHRALRAELALEPLQSVLEGSLRLYEGPCRLLYCVRVQIAVRTREGTSTCSRSASA